MEKSDQGEGMPKKKSSSLCQIKLEISLGRQAKTEKPVFLFGNLPVLGDWDPKKVRLNKDPDGIFRFPFEARENQVVELKINRGSQKRQGVYGPPFEGFPPSNIMFRAAKDLTVPISVMQWFDQVPPQRDPVQGDLRNHRFPAANGLRNRRVFVWLPPSYGSGNEKYPVLYAYDGQNLFDPGFSFSDHDWKADEVATSLIRKNRVREFIIVAVANSADRDEEYNLYRPLGKCYAQWFLHTLMPAINSRYRTLTGPKNTALMGSSLGALISFQMAFHFPEVFSMAGCLSPAFWLNRSRLYQQVRSATDLSRSTKFYLDAGDMEPEYAESCQKMTEILTSKGWRAGKNLVCHIAPGANHSELAWSRRVHLPFEFFFGK